MTLRAFVAAEVGRQVDHAGLERLRGALREVPGRITLVDPNIVHLTIRFLGDIEEGMVPVLVQAIRAACQGTAPIIVKVQGVGVFPPKGPPKVVWLGVEGAEPLVKIAERFEPTVRGLGLRKDLPFKAHVTVARVRALNDRSALPAVMDRFQSVLFGTARITGLVLMRSDLRPTGPVYTPVEEVPFPVRAGGA